MFGTLITVAPLGATAGIPINITGTGFNTVAANNLVTFTPESGTPQTIAASAVTTVDATRDWRRVTVTVPQGLPAVRTALTVTNKATGGSSSGLSIEVLQLFPPEPTAGIVGTLGLRVLISASSNTNFMSGQSLANFGVGTTVRSLEVLSATQLRATVDIAPNASPGPRNVIARSTNQSLVLLGGFSLTAAAANQPPTANANGAYSGTQDQPITFTSKGSSDPDNDPLTYAWTFGDGGKSTDANPAHTYTAPGTFDVSLTVSDGRGGSATATTTANVAPAVSLTRIDVDPSAIRFSAIEATRAISVIGTRSDNSTTNLTAAVAGTTYGSSNPFVASVSADGLVTARGNGEAVVTATNGALSDTVAVAVESGVTLDSLQLTPATTTLRAPGASQALTLTGTFSDGSVRDLTNAAGTTYASSAGTVASVSPAGLVTAASNGRTDITATHADRSAAAEIVVAIPEGRGFVRGAVFDDSRGLPLPGATVALLSDGGGAVDPPVSALTDETGRYALPARGGDALLRIQKSGFTTVDRTVVVPASAIARALDARLTPMDPHANPLQSVFGGVARDASGATTMTLPAGSLATDTDVRLTPISAQGLHGRLPLGWSPIASVEISPATATLAQTATLLLPNTGGAAAGATITIARYDNGAHAWTAFAAAQVSADGRSLSIGIASSGQYAALLPDAAPFTPPAQVNGQRLTGVDGVAVPEGVTADGDTVPRAAAPGDSARAVGRIGVGGATPLPSGTAMQVHVNETFELLDASTVIPLPFTQDILVHARPRPPNGGALGATFPITPSRSYTIQELMRGVVQLDVTRPSTKAGGASAGPQGAVVTDTEGDSLILPAGALAGEAVIELRRVVTTTGLPSEFIPLQSFAVDVIGSSLALPARLSTAIPNGITASDQVLLVHTFIDALGVRRMRVAGLGRIEGDRLVSDHVLGTLIFPGVASGGEYSFAKATEPVGFVAGNISGADGSTPAPLALVTSSNTPFVDVTGSDGRYIVAARAGSDSTVAARHLLSSDTATATAHPAARDAIVLLSLTLAVAPPSVVATSPAAGALNIALDTSIIIDFSEAIDPASIVDASVSLQTGGADVPVSRTLSQDRRRLTVRPLSPLLGKTTYVLSLTSGVKDLSGAPLVAFTPLSFVTLDPTKPPQPPPGQIVAELPDADGLILVTGTSGSAQSGSPVTATNLRTQETFTVLASADGSFRLRLSAVVGDEVTLTLRDTDGRESTIVLSQFDGPDGAAIGVAGGVIRGAGNRTGTILPRALSQAGVFSLRDVVDPQPLVLDSAFAVVDRFTLSIEGAAFSTLSALTLTESQGRFAPVTMLGAPFEAVGQLTLPADFLVNGSLRFSALVEDAAGVRRSASGATVVVASTPNTTVVESGQAAEFPTVFLTVPREALPNQVVGVAAIAPAARIDLTVPAPAASLSGPVLLTRIVDVNGELRLSIVDALVPSSDGTLRTAGRTLPGMGVDGNYAIVASSEALSFVTGELVGAAGIVAVDGLPFVFETNGPNGRFSVPVRANAPYTLRFIDADGSLRGTTAGQAPAAGVVDIGDPLGIATGQLRVALEQDQNTSVDINAALRFRFSEPVDVRTLVSAVVITDPAGARVFGRFAMISGSVVEFRPSRRWRFGTTYRVGLSTTARALSGASLQTPFAGQFRTFATSVLSQATLGTVSDVSVADSVALLTDETGASTVTVAAALNPQRLARIAAIDGARAVAHVPGASITTRTGQALSGKFALIATGGAATASWLRLYDISNPASPVLLGSTQLTGAPGGSAPAGVIDAPGTPRQIVVTADNRALIAIEGVGVVAVRLDLMSPDDPSNAGQAIAGRYPSIGAGTATSIALLDDRAIVASVEGLTVLDANSLERRAALQTGTLVDVSALPSLSVDVNGDGVLSPATEVFDFAAATGGADGTLQFFRIPPDGDPLLISVVRLSGETAAVVLDATERLAFVSVGAAGLALVDIDGPASVQPIDFDRSGIDDRLLGEIDTPGAARRTALTLSHGRALVADGPGGLSVIRVLPPRVRFVNALRDPVRAVAGDEQSMLSTRTAYATDDALVLEVDLDSDGEAAVLVLEQGASAAAVPPFTFSSGGLGESLAPGTTSVVLLNSGSITPPSSLRVSIRSLTGETLASFEIAIAQPDPGTAQLESLLTGPLPAVIGATDPDNLQLGVAGAFDDGRIFNLSRGSTGTTYRSGPAGIASISGDGLATALGGGVARIEITNGASSATMALTVERPRAIVALRPGPPALTFRAAALAQPVDAIARFSDGTEEPAAAVAGTSFMSSDESIATVSSAGLVTAVAEGEAVIIVRNGPFQLDIPVHNEWRAPPSVISISIVSPEDTVSVDDGQLLLAAVVHGSGSLDGLTVSFTVTGVAAAQLTGVTALDGSVSALLQGIALSGALNVTASIVDPATGQSRSDAATIPVAPPRGDAEPNDSLAAAASLEPGLEVSGSVDSATDSVDSFRVPAAFEGSTTVLLTLPDGTDGSQVLVIARDANGVELARFTPPSGGGDTSMAVPPGTAFVTVQALSGQLTYDLDVDFDQAPITISGMAPVSGGRGTPVTIDGSGFGSSLTDAVVLFGGIPGRVTSVTPGRIQVLAPGNAITGAVRVIVSAREALGPLFTAAGGGPLTPVMRPSVPSSLSVQPGTNALTLIDRLTITADPLATRSEIDAVATRVGAQVVGIVPAMHLYVLEFAGNRSFNTLQGHLASLSSEPLVTDVSMATFDRTDGIVQIDMQDIVDQGDRNAHEMMDLFEAVEAIRSTPPFDDRDALKDVRVAIVDDGFNPGIRADEFQNSSGKAVKQFRPNFTEDPAPGVAGDHGTPIVSIVGAINNGQAAGGVLNSVIATDERPYNIHMYRVDQVSAGQFNTDDVVAALSYVANASPAYHVVNISIGTPTSQASATDAQKHRRKYRNAMLPGAGNTLFVLSGGNDGIFAKDHSPCVLSRTMSHVICVGAVATATDGDGSGEDPDERADFARDKIAPARSTLCVNNRHREASNCGPEINIAAPGEDLFSVQAGGSYGTFFATSGAAPMLAGVAALVHAVWQDANPLLPDRLRRLLIATADNISRQWNPGNMRRVNALSAVRAVLPETRPQKVYITDDDAETLKGFVIGVEVDPLSGKRAASPQSDLRIPLKVTRRGSTIELLRPSTVVTGTATNRLYVAAETDDGAYGDGVVVINSHDYSVRSFIPLSGVPFPAGTATGRPPVKFGSKTPALRLSKDERILYVLTMDRLVVISTESGRVVEKFKQLPAAYRARAATQPAGEMLTRLQKISDEASELASTGGWSFADAAVSPDGRTLYLAVRTGGGTGAQPGYVLPVNIDLYTDASTTLRLLQSDLSNYLKPGDARAMTGTPLMQADEPSVVAPSPDGKHLYLANGGVEKFEGKPPESQGFSEYLSFVMGNIFGSASAGSGMAGLQSSEAQFQLAQPQLLQQMQLDAKLTAESGRTLLFAEGMTGVLDVERPATVPGETGSQQWLFPSRVTFGWNPPLGGGVSPVIDQFNFREIFAKRPFGMAIRPDGGRALVSYFQTGNFGVLDLSKQSLFSNPSSGGVPTTLFQGVLAVTEAIRLDNHLWPQRGAYTYFENGAQRVVPSPDEDLMYPGPIEYAQNGEFAAAVHTGTKRPRTLTAPLPDFANDNDARLSLSSIGFTVGAGASAGTDPEGNSVSSFQPYEFVRGGGTITLLHDDLIDADLNNAGQPVAIEGGSRTYFAVNPLCQELMSTLPRCRTPVFDLWPTYDIDGTIKRFSRPRGVSIQPFVAFETPAFGNYVVRSSLVRFRWRDARVRKFVLEVLDLGTTAAPLATPARIDPPIDRAVTAREQLRQTVGLTFVALFGANAPQRNHVYRIRAKVITGDGSTLSETSVDVLFER